MWVLKTAIFLQILYGFCFLGLHSQTPKQYDFVVEETQYTRLCSNKSILTVNGEFPGPTISAYKNDTIYVNVYNKGKHNITIHWHGVKMPSYPWSDGPEYITQCPIKPGEKFRQKVIFSTEEGTLWWHAHSDWSRATVHGAIIIYPQEDKAFPFPKPHAEVPIIFGEWWKNDVWEVFTEFQTSGGSPNSSDAITINGQPGDMYPCSKSGTFKLNVDYGKTYLLRIVNAAMNLILFFSISKHKLKVVGADGCYTKPLIRDYIAISPGQTIDALLCADQLPGQYYMAARAYSSSTAVLFDNTTTTAILHYNGIYPPIPRPSLPYLPYYNDTQAAFDFFGSLRGLPIKYPKTVPLNATAHIETTLSLNSFPCPNNDTQSCEGPNGTRFASSINNISFVSPSIDILEAYYYHINGVYSNDFPTFPPFLFNFTGEYLPLELLIPENGTKVIVLNFGTEVELVFQGTNLFGGIDHPMHLHGYSFHVIGYGFGNFDKDKDPLKYNLNDPPLLNTVVVPRNGWTTIRFKATNPGVWLMHCHLERHITWGMETVFIVKNGTGRNETLLPPPADMPPCRRII
ncbi:hypothetical protein L6164_007022 [Bauhinia variegata]|uniref:Uncharacterized protein n=1 Tax=Bauhinia variegata TaxID=167791 RepID=A0ACB9PY29_BAUVA|nr:hypothetical protein L6164_007022 [Bauhinia variegata]